MKNNNYQQSLKELHRPIVILGNIELSKMYKARVRKHLKTLDLSSLENYSERGFNKYHIDHKISVNAGFRSNIPVHVINDITNLRCIPELDNREKGMKCFIDDSNKWMLPYLCEGWEKIGNGNK